METLFEYPDIDKKLNILEALTSILDLKKNNEKIDVDQYKIHFLLDIYPKEHKITQLYINKLIKVLICKQIPFQIRERIEALFIASELKKNPFPSLVESQQLEILNLLRKKESGNNFLDQLEQN